MAELPGTDPADEDEGGCSWCERGSGLILVAGAVGLLYIGLDLISGGALSRMFIGGVRSAAEAIDPDSGPGQDDGDGQAPELGAAVAGDDGNT
jgi:hypothetical protein